MTDVEQLNNWQAKYSVYSKVISDVDQLVRQYSAEFHGARYVDDLDIEEDEITFNVMYSYCGCCSDEGTGVRIPASYLWDKDWIEKETEVLRLREEMKVKKEAQEEADKKQQAEKDKRATYDRLKQEFEG